MAAQKGSRIAPACFQSTTLSYPHSWSGGKTTDDGKPFLKRSYHRPSQGIIDPVLWEAKRRQLAERNKDRPTQGGQYRNTPPQLLRFIRNCYVHLNEGTNAEDRSTDWHWSPISSAALCSCVVFFYFFFGW
jgi:hypothetical protein